MIIIAITFFAIFSSACSAFNDPRKHLFILSGQSNMEGLEPNTSFTPTVKNVLGSDNILVVKDAKGGQPIRRWYKGVKLLNSDKGQPVGNLYDRLMTKVRLAIKPVTIRTITFVWMQGEEDAFEGHGEIYAVHLKGLIDQLKRDLGRDDINVVIGRLSDYGGLDSKRSAHWTMIRNAQMAVATADARTVWVNTDDLNDGLNRNGQEIENDLHYSAAGYAILGQRFANEAIQLIEMKPE